ncbi:cytochrome oxidase Cu insertion factor (SCO1/SenC/PrrC family) [Pedobacter cryoconitis]|nr:cytochrome oxidase Cu insertion factor (SCO1/SenC/PrrC family) [Pedobacter cryoconitis]
MFKIKEINNRPKKYTMINKSITRLLILSLSATFYCLGTISTVSAQNSFSKIKISGTLNVFEKDSIVLTYRSCKLPLGESAYLPYNQKTVAISDEGGFEFELPDTSLVYFNLSYKAKDGNIKEILNSYIAEPNDNVDMLIQNVDLNGTANNTIFAQNISFSGEGIQKYKYQYLLNKNQNDNEIKWELKKNLVVKNTIEAELERTISFANTLDDSSNSLSLNYESLISNEAYQLIKFNLFAKKMNIIYKHLNIFTERINSLNDTNKRKFMNFYQTRIKSNIAIPQDVLANSAFYPSFLLRQFLFEGRTINGRSLLDQIYEISNDKLRERVLTEYILNYYTHLDDQETIASNAIKKMNDPQYIQLLKELIKNQSFGTKVVDFMLVDENSKEVKLSQFLGKVVFIDFWYTGCSGCTLYYQDLLSKVEKDFQDNKKIVFISVSIDRDKEKWLKSIKDGKYTSPHAVNLYTNGLGSNHAILKQLAVYSYPRPIVIDKQGKLYNNSRTDLRISAVRLSQILSDAINKN